MPFSTPRASWFTLALALVGCGAGTSPAPPDASATDAPVTDAPTVDTPIVDAPAIDSMCQVECAAPPPGCHYEGSATCNPPRCPPLVCPPDAGPDVAVDVTRDAPADAAQDATAIVCSAGGGGSFPTFDRSCGGDADCFIATHQTDCCGNSRALGLAVSQRDAFNAAERICDAMYPGCGCPARPPVADDGMSAIPPATLAVACRTGVCTTFVRSM